MKKLILVKHAKGAFGLRFLGLGPNLRPCRSLHKLQNFLDNNTFWANNRSFQDLKKCIANSDVVISLWLNQEIVGFGRGLSDGVYRGVLWDIVIDQQHQGKGFGKLIVNNLLNAKQIKHTKKIYLMTTNKKNFYSQVNFKEVDSQNLLIREI